MPKNGNTHSGRMKIVVSHYSRCELHMILNFYSGKGKSVPVYIMKACGRVELYFLPFLTLALDWKYVVNVTPWRLYPEESNYGTH